MSFLRTSTSFTRFQIVDEVPHSFWDSFLSRLQQYAFVDIDDTAQERSVGWVSFEDVLDMDFTTPYTIGEYVVFAWRMDTRRLPPAVFKKHYTLRLKEEFNIIAQQGKKYISKERKIELKEQVRLKLFSRILPIPAHFEIIWSVRRNELYFSSTNKKVVDAFSEYFMHSFTLEICPITPLHQAYTLLPQSQHALLERLQITDFTRSI